MCVYVCVGVCVHVLAYLFICVCVTCMNLHFLIQQIVNEDTMYVSHFLRVRYHDYPAQFQQVTDTQAHTHLEVDEMR